MLRTMLFFADNSLALDYKSGVAQTQDDSVSQNAKDSLKKPWKSNRQLKNKIWRITSPNSQDSRYNAERIKYVQFLLSDSDVIITSALNQGATENRPDLLRKRFFYLSITMLHSSF